MISGFYAEGWALLKVDMVQDQTCVVVDLYHRKLPTVGLQIHVCLDEMPALTMVSLLDQSGTIEREWSDKEINVLEICAAANILHGHQTGDLL